MRSKSFGLIAGLIAAVFLGFGAIGQATPVGAESPPVEDAPEADVWHEGRPYFWLRESIIDGAALTIGISDEEVKYWLRQGASLKEIGIAHGVRPEVLEDGILRHERHFLDRLVNAGVLRWWEAARIFYFLNEHIERIISYHPPAV